MVGPVPLHQPGRATMLFRGLTRRCARCGSGHLFHRWFSMVDDCPGCGLHFEREQGYWVGALAMNIVVVGGLVGVLLVATLALTIPDVPVVEIIALVLPVAALGPVVFHPFSKTTWVAVDRAFLQRLDHAETLDEQVRRI